MDSPSLQKPQRLASLDAYRGFVMLLMASGGFGLAGVAAHSEPSGVWDFIRYQVSHAPWTGCALWDLIQPSFMFLAGASLPFSYANRRARGESLGRIALHVLWRSAALVLLGIFLRSDGRKHTYFTFEDVLTQIGLGYAFVYLLVDRGWRVQLAAALVILLGYWYLFYRYPLPGPGFDYAAVGMPQGGWPFTGLAAHWNKNTNLAAAFDQWFLNLFPREQPFRFNSGGYQTLNFVPSMATMIFGMMAGDWLRGPAEPGSKIRRLLILSAVCFALSIAVDQTIWPFAHRSWTLCPVVKRIWTPSWAVFSTGWTLLLLAGFYALVDLQGRRRPVFPLIVVGMNSIAMYVMAELSTHWIRDTLRIHLGAHAFDGRWGPLWASVLPLGVMWLACLWMYRRKVFIRI